MENKATYALSQREMAIHLMALSVAMAIQLQQVDSEVENDSELSKLKKEVLHDSQLRPTYIHWFKAGC